MTKLSEKQQKILDFLRKQHTRTGVYPSVREIAAHMDFKSTNTVDYHLKKLEQAGALERGQRRARSYGVPQASTSFNYLREKPSAQFFVEPPKMTLDGHVPYNWNLSPAPARGVPLVGRVAAGAPILAEQNFEEMIDIQEFFGCDSSTFALNVRGDSMVDAAILDGDIVIVRSQPIVETGEIGVALIEGEATVKRFYDNGDSWRLVPENPTMKAIIVKKGDKDFSIAGKVIGVIRKI